MAAFAKSWGGNSAALPLARLLARRGAEKGPRRTCYGFAILDRFWTLANCETITDWNKLSFRQARAARCRPRRVKAKALPPRVARLLWPARAVPARACASS